VAFAPGCFVGAPDRGGYSLQRGRRWLDVAPGMVVVVPPGASFRFIHRQGPEMTQHWLLAEFRLFGVVDLFTLVAPPELLTGAAGAAAAECVASLNAAAAACQRLDLAALARRDALGFRLLELLAAGASADPGLEQRLKAMTRVQPVLRLMEERLAEDLGRADLARALGLSEGRLHTVFASALGMAPYAYLARLRLRRAQDLLLATDDGVGRIAAAVGFRDQFHFSRSFRQAFGVSPSGFRENARSL
jgi:AraC-like DNA-binding protein